MKSGHCSHACTGLVLLSLNNLLLLMGEGKGKCAAPGQTSARVIHLVARSRQCRTRLAHASRCIARRGSSIRLRTMSRCDERRAAATAATCHIRIARQHVEPLRGYAERITQIFGVKLLLPPSPSPNSIETYPVSHDVHNVPNEPLLFVPLRIFSGCAIGVTTAIAKEGSQADTMREIAVRVQVSPGYPCFPERSLFISALLPLARVK